MGKTKKGLESVYLNRKKEILESIWQKNQTVSLKTVTAVLELAIEIAREGREGRKVGTLFVIGDSRSVMKHSHPLILDPLEGHAKEKRHINDPDLRETVKELSQLDGGFIVTADGHVVSATRYFDADTQGIKIFLGLGARHVAGASITKKTKATSIVVSESSVVRVFAEGQLIAEIMPDIWLTSRFRSHIKAPKLMESPMENIAVISTDKKVTKKESSNGK